MAVNFSLLYPPGYDRKAEVPMKDFKFIHSLQIDDMVVLVKGSYRGFADLSLENFYTASSQVLRYRLAVVRDLVENDRLYESFCKAVSVIYNISDLRKSINSDFTTESALSSVRYLEMYQEVVNLFADTFKNCEVHSEGMQALKKQIMSIAESEEFQTLDRELSEMEINFGCLKSVTIGVNLDENLRPKEAGVLSVNKEPFRAGSIMDKLIRKNNDADVLMAPLYPLNRGLRGEELKSLNYAVSGALHTVFAKALRSFEPMIRNYYTIHTSLFVTLLDDIRFLTAGVSFIRSMREQGFSMCCPEIAEMEEKKCELKQVYNPILARKSIEHMIVSNSFSFDEKGRFYLVTGPNHGGKSVFAYSVGMAQALFQLGLYVPAQCACMSPVTGIFTHFPASDENNYGKGRLESECARLGEIMKQLSETDMLLMDESFSSTSGLEAGYIASEVLMGIGIIGCGGIFVTHIHDLPQQVEKYNFHPDNKGKIDNLVALMEDKENGVRSYRIARTKPDGLSYARDIAARYGLNLEAIVSQPGRNLT